MTSKVLEADAGIHSLGMAVAPVVSWKMYDSIYTERYMGKPQNNAGGYTNSSITDVTGFKHADFLLAHGSGDDNGTRRVHLPVSEYGVDELSFLLVHFANSAHLLDMFTQHSVRRFRFRMFTDRYVTFSQSPYVKPD